MTKSTRRRAPHYRDDSRITEAQIRHAAKRADEAAVKALLEHHPHLETRLRAVDPLPRTKRRAPQ
jgi:hypothetical protein